MLYCLTVWLADGIAQDFNGIRDKFPSLDLSNATKEVQLVLTQEMSCYYNALVARARDTLSFLLSFVPSLSCPLQWVWRSSDERELGCVSARRKNFRPYLPPPSRPPPQLQYVTGTPRRRHSQIENKENGSRLIYSRVSLQSEFPSKWEVGIKASNNCLPFPLSPPGVYLHYRYCEDDTSGLYAPPLLRNNRKARHEETLLKL